MSVIFTTIFKIFVIFNIIHNVLSSLSIKRDENYSRIIDGEKTVIERFPFTVQILSKYDRGLLCGGSYIEPKWIITAAHCLFLWENAPISPNYLIVKAGSSTLSYTPSQQYSYVEKIFHHPYYSSSTLLHDIGLVKLENPFDINKYVNYAPIPVNYGKANLYADNSQCTAIGWGSTRDSYFYPTISKQLKSIDVKLMSKWVYMYYKWMNIADDIVIVGKDDGSDDPGQGDSGGPLVCGGYLAGVSSAKHILIFSTWSPSFYTRIDKHVHWIHKTITINT